MWQKSSMIHIQTGWRWAQHFFHHRKTERKMLTFTFLTKIVLCLSLHICSDDVSVNTVTFKKSFSHVITSPFLSKWISASVMSSSHCYCSRNEKSHIFLPHMLVYYVCYLSFEDLRPQNLVFNGCSKTSSYNELNHIATWPVTSPSTWDQQPGDLAVAGSTPWIPSFQWATCDWLREAEYLSFPQIWVPAWLLPLWANTFSTVTID